MIKIYLTLGKSLTKKIIYLLSGLGTNFSGIISNSFRAHEEGDQTLLETLQGNNLSKVVRAFAK